MQPLNKRLQRGESAAFVELYDKFGERLFSFAHARLGSSQDASDVVQEIFIRLVKSHRKLAKAENLNAYVFAIARNETIRWIKKNRKHKPNQQILEQETKQSSSQLTTDKIETDEWVSNLLGRLNEIDQEIVQLKVYSELTFKEIAAITGRPEPNVTSRYRRAIAKLEMHLKTRSSIAMPTLEMKSNDA